MAQTEQETVLRLTRRYNATPEQVFDAWTSAELLRKWWGPQPNFENAGADVDLRPGGRYRLSMTDKQSGATHTVSGEYTEVSRPDRLAYTWQWEGDDDSMAGSEETRIVVEFNQDGDGTEVVLTHSGFTNSEVRDMHSMGWSGCLASLERAIFPS